LSKVAHRPHASPGPGVSDLLALRLPQGLYEIITAYASTSGRSRNEVLVMFLERGLIIYLKGQNILLETIRSLRSELAKTKEPERRNESSQSALIVGHVMQR